MTKPRHQTTDRGRAAAPIVVAQDQATAAVAAPADGEPVAPAPVIPAADKGAEVVPAGEASAPASVEPVAPVEQAIADDIRRAATPVVRVTAVRDRWRAGRFWPKGDTDLNLAEAEQLGRDGFDKLREDNVFTIVPLDRAD